jgi:two-component system sensor histidine kinase/response regulator
VANNGREAVDMLKQQPFDAILMDVQMPEMDGYEATAAIRREEKKTGAHIPIVAMTAYAMKGDRERCLAVGMDRYISKPIRAKELFESVEGSQPASVEPSLGPPAMVQRSGILNEAEALSRVGDDPQLLRELAGVFVSECPRLLDAVHSAVASKDAAKLKIAAHSLKGAVDNFAAQAAYDAALRLEMHGRDGNLAEVEQDWDTLHKEIDRLLPVLADLAAR